MTDKDRFLCLSLQKGAMVIPGIIIIATSLVPSIILKGNFTLEISDTKTDADRFTFNYKTFIFMSLVYIWSLVLLYGVYFRKQLFVRAWLIINFITLIMFPAIAILIIERAIKSSDLCRCALLVWWTVIYGIYIWFYTTVYKYYNRAERAHEILGKS